MFNYKFKEPAKCHSQGVIYISRSLDLNYINNDVCDNSSKIFEDGLLKSLSNKRRVTIIYLGSSNNHTIKNNFEYFSIDYNSIIGDIKLLLLLTKLKNANSTILTSGYNLRLILLLGILNLYRYKTATYVFDTHITAINKMPRLKAIFVNAYFSIGFRSLFLVNSLLVVNDIFIKRDNLNFKYFKTKIGYKDENVGRTLNKEYSHSYPISILCAGTLNNDNGMDIILEFLKKSSIKNVRFDIYGTGDKLNDIIQISKTDSRLAYKGNLTIEALNEEIARADFLLNLRNPTSPTCAFSFPSKLIQYMGSGKPVISNIFPGLDSYYKDSLVLINDYSWVGLENTIKNLPNEELSIQLGNSAKSLIKKENDWDILTDKLIDYLDNL